jgi:hypothetical protein
MTADHWTVRDLNAVDKPRVHDLGPAGKHTLNAHEGVRMPQEHAVHFLRDPSFHVVDENGDHITSLERSTAVGTQATKPLRADQVVATLQELKAQALLARCTEYPDGRAFKSTTKVDVMIAFLLDKAKMVGRPAAGEGPTGDVDVEDVPDDQIPPVDLTGA